MSSLPDPLRDLGLILDLVPTIVWVMARDGELSYINEFGRERLGLHVDPGTKVSLLDCIHPADRRRAEAQWSGPRSHGDGWSGEFRVRSAGEDARRMLLTSRAVPGPTGALAGWVGTCTDVEDERAAGDALRRSAIDMGLLLAEARGD
jgi:PAS domain-containing protein